MNEIKIFENEELGLQIRAILNPDGSISVNAEDTAIGFGWTTVAKSGNEVVRWARMNGYCKELGFANELAKEDYIPESLYYLLGMKANNVKAQKYQRWLAMDVLPTLRKEGRYTMPGSQDSPIAFTEQIHDIASAVAKEVVTIFKAEMKEEIKAELREEFKIHMATEKRPVPSLVETPSPTYAIPQVFERLGTDKAKEISRMYGSTELESLSCIFRRMNALDADFGVIRDRATAINPLTSASVLKQIAVFPAYHDAFFRADEEFLNA